jgi:hypothetical protein
MQLSNVSGLWRNHTELPDTPWQWNLRRARRIIEGMNLIAIVLGVLAILIVLVTAIVPIIGAIFAWIALIIGVIGLVFGILSKSTKGRNISILACVLAGLRLALGGLLI